MAELGWPHRASTFRRSDADLLCRGVHRNGKSLMQATHPRSQITRCVRFLSPTLVALSYCLTLLCHSFCFAQFSMFQTWVCLVLLTDPASQGQGLVSPFLLLCLMGCLARGRHLGPDSSVWGVLPSPEELISLLALCYMPAVPQYPERPDMVEMPISCLVLPLILRTLVLTKGEGIIALQGARRALSSAPQLEKFGCL